MEYLFIFAAGFAAGYAYVLIKGYLALRKLVRQAGINLNAAKPEVKERYATIEVINGVAYAWSADSNQFICSFKTTDELKDGLRRYDRTSNWFLDKPNTVILDKYLGDADERKADAV